MPELKEEVKEAVEKQSEESSNSQEEATSPEVKEEVTTEEVKPIEVEVNKDKEQISNLNKALKQEREARKKMEEKSLELENQIKTSSETIERLKSVFSPEETQEMENNTEYMTKEEADQYFEQKFEERVKQQEEEKKAESIKNEIKELEKEFNGEDGKPKYDDQEVLLWQKNNNKLYLSPKEAFNFMKQNEIIDWQVKQRLENKKEVENVETPGSVDTTHTPEEFVPTSETETRQAILEAMESAEKDI